MDGWVKLYRQIWDNPVVTKDSDHLAVWIYLLTTASHQDHNVIINGKREVLHSGQLLTGRLKIAEYTRVSESKVTRILKLFESEQQIEQRMNNKNRVITILNWSLYQESEQQSEQQLNNNRTTTEQQLNTNKNGKNDKNEKNGKNGITRIKGPFFLDEQLNQAFLDYIEHRKAIRKAIKTDKAIDLAIQKLNQLSGGDNDKAIAIINQSIVNGWTGLFELKQDKKGGINWDDL